MKFSNFKENKREKQEKEKVYLFIDDNANFLNSLSLIFNKKNIFFEECHSKEEALNAIYKINPDVVFLDNNLSREDTNDGLAVVDSLKGSKIKFYSITFSTDEYLLNEYRKRGVEILGKLNLEKIRKVIEEG
jgi:two-component SAPR family response regulator